MNVAAAEAPAEEFNQNWAVPLFMLRPPLDPAIAWRFSAPSLESPVCQMPTTGQIDSPVFEKYRTLLRIRAVPHRRNWEQVWLLAMAEAAGVLKPGMKAIGFGCGTEAMPSALAHLGLTVTATDLPADAPAAAHWIKARQHSTEAAQLFREAVVEQAAFAELVSFRPADIMAIPPALKGEFDLCWSCAVVPHLGGVDAAVDAIEAAMSVLKPGGVALHTANLLLSSPDTLVEGRLNTALRRRDVEHLLSRLISAGHEPWPLNLYPGDEPADAHLDAPPHALPHLKVKAGENNITSIGIAIRRAQ
ncbi:methyltransferase domain-containing protein [Acetobacteraceae bacterium H6797]|nr:methyltransferase domain-containing protein [Acetobacteraceae bacterium H6797]